MLDSSPPITVIMAVHNGAPFVQESIQSILTQTFKHFEFLIIDDGSTDNSLEILDSTRDSRVTILSNKTRETLPRALNKCLAQVKTEFVARQDADDLSEPDRLQKQIDFLQSHPEVALVSSCAHLIDDNGQVIGVTNCPGDVTESFRVMNPIVHGSVMLRRQVLQAVGGYDEFFEKSQDYELWMRIDRRAAIAIVPDRLYKKRIHLGNLAPSNVEKALLYQMINVKTAKGELSSEQILQIKCKGYRSVREHMSKSDLAFIEKGMATAYMETYDWGKAIKAYKRAILFQPFCVKHYCNWVLSLIGPSVWRRLHRIAG